MLQDASSVRMVMTILGKDRPGIVASISKRLFEMGGNIEDSSMTILEGEFAMILIVSFNEDIAPQGLREAFSETENSLGVKVYIKPLQEDEMVRDEMPGSSPYVISIFGIDRPGIISEVASLLADRSVNITDMKTKVIGGEKGDLYAMVIEADMPEDVDHEDIQKKLSEIKKRLNVDITIRPIESLQL